MLLLYFDLMVVIPSGVGGNCEKAEPKRLTQTASENESTMIVVEQERLWDMISLYEVVLVMINNGCVKVKIQTAARWLK